jgi:Rrf2 family protein
MTGEFAVAVHALVYLRKRGETLDSEALARNVCTNPARVRKVMAKLKQAGLVEAKAGAEGGYRFMLDPAAVTLRRVADALQEVPVAAGWRSGDPSMDCMVASGMAAAMDRVYDELNRACLDRLSSISLSDVEAQLGLHGPCARKVQDENG